MAKQRMSLAELAELDVIVLTPVQAASVIGCDAYAISVAAETAAGRELLGFPVIRVGNRTKIPRIPLLEYLGWRGPIVGARTDGREETA